MLLKLTTFLLLLRLTLLEITKLQLKFKLRVGGYGRRTSQAMCITSRTETRIKRKSNHHKRRIS